MSKWTGFIIVLATVCATPSWPQVEIDTRVTVYSLWRSDGPVEKTRPGEVCLERADFSIVDHITRDQVLMQGDLLTFGPCPGELAPEPGGPLLVGLICEDGKTRLGLSSNFRTKIGGSEDGCAMDWMEGVLDVHTDGGSPKISSAGVRLGVEGTRFTVLRDPAVDADGFGSLTCLVFEGRVRLRGEKIESTTLKAGEAWTRRGSRVLRGVIGLTERLELAARAARLDAARAYALDPSSLQDRVSAEVERFERLHQDALERPGDTKSRKKLDEARRELSSDAADGGSSPDQIETGGSPPTEGPMAQSGTVFPSPIADLGRNCKSARDGVWRCSPIDSLPSSVRIVYLKSTTGITIVTLPWDLRGGEQVSGFFEVSGAGEGKKERKNEKRFDRFRIGVGTAVLPAEFGPWSVRLEAPGGLVEIALLKPRGQALVSESLKLGDLGVAASSGEDFIAPGLCRADRSMTILGPFDGDHRTTRITVGGEEATILAESPRQATIRCPGMEPGGYRLRVEEGERRVSMEGLAIVGFDFDVAKKTISKGEKTTVTIRLLGVAGVDQSIGVQVRNKVPDIVSFESGEEVQFLQFRPSLWQREGSVERVFEVRGRKVGSTSFEVELIPFDWHRLEP